MFRICALLSLLTFAASAQAEVSGILRVIDADTFDIGDTRIRLFGVDAPEMGQPCVTESGDVWDCGAWAANNVKAQFEGSLASCTSRDIDRYGRTVATCKVGSFDIGGFLVGEGWAWAYRRYAMDYDLTEKGAAVANRGLWSFQIQSPSDWRAARITQATAPDPSCAIKGNISGSGRIFHTLHNRDYDRTQINIAKGERWFCSVSEALAAGWRAARN